MAHKKKQVRPVPVHRHVTVVHKRVHAPRPRPVGIHGLWNSIAKAVHAQVLKGLRGS